MLYITVNWNLHDNESGKGTRLTNVLACSKQWKIKYGVRYSVFVLLKTRVLRQWLVSIVRLLDLSLSHFLLPPSPNWLLPSLDHLICHLYRVREKLNKEATFFFRRRNFEKQHIFCFIFQNKHSFRKFIFLFFSKSISIYTDPEILPKSKNDR